MRKCLRQVVAAMPVSFQLECAQCQFVNNDYNMNRQQSDAGVVSCVSSNWHGGCVMDGRKIRMLKILSKRLHTESENVVQRRCII